MAVGYFCATPLHIIHAVNMRLTTDKDLDGDIYVYNHFADAPRMTESLKEMGLFRRVTLYRNSTLTLKEKGRRLWHAFVPDDVIRPLLTEPFPYEKAVFFALDALTMTQLMEKGKECAFYYGEDGIGSYINPGLYRCSDVSRLLLRLTGRDRLMERVKGIYLHDPDLRVANTHIAAVKMEKIPYDDPVMERVWQILWPVDERVLDIRRPVMYFREPLQEVFDEDASSIEREALGLAEAFFGGGVYIKRHPRMADGGTDERVLPCNAPYERLMELWEQPHTVLISAISTAALQPLLLCGQRPVMIFLYRMLLEKDHPLRRLWDDFFEKLTACYDLNGRLFTPDDIGELKEAMAQAAELLKEWYGNQAGNTKE